MLADFGENRACATANQILSKSDAQLMRLDRITCHLPGNEDGSG
jgi:hypothetical protein